MTIVDDLVVKRLGQVAYLPTLEAMRRFTSERSATTPDELWLLEHPPVYTLGQGAAPVQVRNGIPVMAADRGGEVTYHGPGQVVLYTLVDIGRRAIKVREFVRLLEQAVIDLIGTRAARRPGAPGVYVDGAKVAALGIRVMRGRACCFRIGKSEILRGLALGLPADIYDLSETNNLCGVRQVRRQVDAVARS